MKKLLILVLFITILPVITIAQNNPKPFVIPELKSWKGSSGVCSITAGTRIVYPSGNDDLKHIAELLSDDYFTMFNIRLEVATGRAGRSDISLALKNNKKLGEEGYIIDIGNNVRISAPFPVGIYWATRTILQMTEQSADYSLPKGTITDFPDYKMRGFMLDCGRKFIPLEFLEDYVSFLSYYKMNTFHIHLNDNGFKKFFEEDWKKTYAAFRLESVTFPGLAAQDGYYTKQEFIDLQILAESKFVEIVPEIDVPAHSLAFSLYKPEIAAKDYDMDHLDLFAPETYEFLNALFDEYLSGDNPVFRGPRVHIGTDEYSNEKKEVIEKFRYFTDYYIKYIQQYGKQAGVWGALSHARGDTPVESENVLMWLWNNGFADPYEMVQQGYKLVSIPDGFVYMVPNAGYYHDFLNIEALYDKWTPAIVGDKVFQERDPMIEGGMFALWNDHAGNGVTTKDIHYRILPSMKTLSTKMWTGANTTVPFSEFNVLKENISEGPGLNMAAKIGTSPAKVLELPSLENRQITGLTEIGYNYTITFDLKGKAEKRGSELFTSPNAVFYLSDPIKGMMGFSRDGYLNTFNYRVKENEDVKIMICGDLKSTRLYVNGKEVVSHQPTRIFTKEANTGIYYTETLVFPLEISGYFNSGIGNVVVYNYCLDKGSNQ